MNLSGVRFLRVGFFTVLTIWFTLFGCSGTLSGTGGCSPDFRGIAIFPTEFPAEFGQVDVRPRYICSGDPVTVTWSFLPQMEFIGCGPGTDDLGCTTGVQRDLLVEALLESTPENLFADETGMSPRRASSGSATVNPTVDTNIFVSEIVEGRGVVALAIYAIHIVPRDPPTVLPQTHSWSCTNATGGQPGWSSVIYERGQLASDNAPIVEVTNTTPFDIVVYVQRDGLIGAEIRQSVLHVGESTDNFNGPYFGVWTVVPHDPTMFAAPNCPTGSTGTLDQPDAPQAIITPLPDITLDITLACPTMTP